LSSHYEKEGEVSRHEIHTTIETGTGARAKAESNPVETIGGTNRTLGAHRSD
jgi:hypothetical protein